jgi:hypothetical protein
LEVQSIADRCELHYDVVESRREVILVGRIGSFGHPIVQGDMVADAPGLEYDTKLIWRGQHGVRNGKNSTSCELD